MADSPHAPQEPLGTADPHAAHAPAEHDRTPEVDPEALVGTHLPPALGPEDEPAPEAPDVDPDASRAWITEGISALDPENAGPGAAAFFDVDNTIIRGSSFAVLARGMADRDYFTTAEVMEFTWKQLKYVMSGKENLDDMAQATENGLLFVKDREQAEIEDVAEVAYDERMVGRLWAGTVELAEAHKALGHEVWLVSATPVEVAGVIARRLGLTGGLGTIAEVADGRYTGRLEGLPLHGAAKVAAVQRLATERGMDLARCAAYSDSANDIPMLNVVGCPVAINPDGPLRAHARAEGWQIRDYRIRGKQSVRRGVPAAAAAGLAVGAAAGVAKGISVIRGRSTA
ncbi:MAG: HAD-IB family hydrolase [Candidatus Nanopelagicales bacterium]